MRLRLTVVFVYVLFDRCCMMFMCVCVCCVLCVRACVCVRVCVCVPDLVDVERRARVDDVHSREVRTGRDLLQELPARLLLGVPAPHKCSSKVPAHAAQVFVKGSGALGGTRVGARAPQGQWGEPLGAAHQVSFVDE